MTDDYAFRVRYGVLGNHVHCRLYSQRDAGMTWQLIGTIVTSRGDEFLAFARKFGPNACMPDDDSIVIDIVEDAQP